MNALSRMESKGGVTYLLLNIKRHWYLFVASLLVLLGLAYLYNKFATKEYLIRSTILLQDQQTPAGSAAMNSFATEIGMFGLGNAKDNIKNESVILQSRFLIRQVVEDLDLNIRLYKNTGVHAQEIYEEAPFQASLQDVRVDSVWKRLYEIHVEDENTLRIVGEDEEMDMKGSFGKPIKLPQYDLLLSRNELPVSPGSSYSVEIVSIDDAISQILANYSVQFTDKSVTTVDMELVYPHPRKGEVILDRIMNRYLENNIQEKIRMADSMLVFIDNRLNVVAQELNEVEQSLEEFRSSNRITDISEQSRMLIGNASDYYNKLQAQQTQLSAINELEGYLQDPANPVVPSSLNIQNPSFAASLAQYNSLLLERQQKSLSYTDANPVIQNLDEQIKSVRNNLLQNVAAYKKELTLSTRSLGNESQAFNSQIQQIPGKERVFLDYSRQQSLKQQLYMYLLQRWEEAAIAKNSNMPGSKIVDAAKSSTGPVKPPKSMIYFMAFVMGLILPLTYVNSKDFLRSRIKSELDIEKYTDISIIGKIGRNTGGSDLVIDKTSNSLVAESFRSLRTNLQFVLNYNASNVIMVTSSMNGEGKTFLSWNLGSSLALAGKKVVLMELDLRKPKLSTMMGLDFNESGFTDYINGKLDVDAIIKPCLFNENCFLISSGPVMNNPSEMLLDAKLGKLIEHLRERFDYVIIDSPPVGLVSDALIIEKHTDLTMYVARHNYTNKSHIEIVNELKRKTRIQNLYLVVNDVNLARAGYFGYGHAYI